MCCSHDGKWLLWLGNGARMMMQKIVDVFGGSVRRRKREIHPADVIVGTGRVRRGLGKGGIKWALENSRTNSYVVSTSTYLSPLS